jgi:hypothetical protein
MRPNNRRGIPWCLLLLSGARGSLVVVPTTLLAGRSVVRVPVEGDLIFSRNVLSSSGAHPASYSKHIGAPCPGVKRPVYEVDHSHPCSSEIRNEWSYTSSPHMCL